MGGPKAEGTSVYHSLVPPPLSPHGIGAYTHSAALSTAPIRLDPLPPLPFYGLFFRIFMIFSLSALFFDLLPWKGIPLTLVLAPTEGRLGSFAGRTHRLPARRAAASPHTARRARGIADELVVSFSRGR